jgi:CRP-like cAMP-binding protein
MAESPYSESVKELFTGGRIKKYQKNQIIFYQGDPLTNVCLVSRGYIKAYTILDSGDTRTLFLLGPGDIFPIAFSVNLEWDKYNIKYFYQSLSDVELKTVERDDFKNNIQNDPHFMNIYLNYMAATNEAIIKQLEMMKTKGAINKVSALLPYLVSKFGESIEGDTYRLGLKLSHQEVADLTGLTRETTTQQVKKLEKEGIITQKRGTWIVKTTAEQE